MVTGFGRRARSLLANPGSHWVIAALALLFLAASLGNGLAFDDYFHRMVVRDGQGFLGEARKPLDQFAFFSPNAKEWDAALNSGVWPWWGSHVKISFLRPVTALTHWLDYAVWSKSTWAAHLQSLFWYGALVLVVSALYRRTLTARWIAALATLVYAFDSGHALPVGWLATRNMLLAVLFGVVAISSHHRFRMDGWRPGRWLAPLALLVSLFSAEFGLGALGYLVAHALAMERGSLRARALGLVPYFVVVMGWQLVYRALGYGTANTALYTDPVGQPAGFVAALFERVPLLLASQLTLHAPEALFVLPAHWVLPGVLVACALLGLFAWLFWPQLAADPVQRWYAVGAVLSVMPACGTFAHSRMCMFAGIGAAALVARLVQRAFDASARSRRLTGIAVTLLVLHTLVSALLLPLGAIAPHQLDRLLRTSMSSLPDDAPLRNQTLVVVNSPHMFLSNFVCTFRSQGTGYGAICPGKIRTLGETLQAVRVTRIDASTLQLETADGYFAGLLYHITWTPRDRRPAGFTRDLGDTRYLVREATPDGRPESVRVTFAEPLESPRYRWVAWQGKSFTTFAPPAVGSTVTLAAVDARYVLTNVD